MIMRKCECGVIATTEEDLELFEKDDKSKYGRRNRCKECASDKSRGGEEIKRSVTCYSCKKVYTNPLEIHKMFRITASTGDAVVGSTSKICKTCEVEALLNSGIDMVELDGRLIPKDLNNILKGVRISSKTIEAIEVPKGILEKIQLENNNV